MRHRHAEKGILIAIWSQNASGCVQIHICSDLQPLRKAHSVAIHQRQTGAVTIGALQRAMSMEVLLLRPASMDKLL
jgi:hypothetical protein